MLTLRLAVPSDGIAIRSIIDDYKAGFQDDYKTIEPEVIIQGIQNGLFFAVDATDGGSSYPIGLIAFNGLFEDLFVYIHPLIRPQYMLPFIRERVGFAALDLAFERFHVRKIKAQVMETQKSAIKMCHYFGFKQRGFFPRETRQNGKLTGVFLLELTQHRWKEFKRQALKGATTTK